MLAQNVQAGLVLDFDVYGLKRGWVDAEVFQRIRTATIHLLSAPSSLEPSFIVMSSVIAVDDDLLHAARIDIIRERVQVDRRRRRPRTREEREQERNDNQRCDGPEDVFGEVGHGLIKFTGAGARRGN